MTKVEDVWAKVRAAKESAAVARAKVVEAEQASWEAARASTDAAATAVVALRELELLDMALEAQKAALWAAARARVVKEKL